MNCLQKVIEDYNKINTNKDLAKRGLTLYEKIVIKECIRELKSKGYAINCITNVTRYFEKFGFVSEKYKIVCYKIKAPDEQQ